MPVNSDGFCSTAEKGEAVRGAFEVQPFGDEVSEI